VALRPGDADALAVLGTTYMIAGHLDEGIAALSESVRLKPDDEQVQMRLRVAIARKNLVPQLAEDQREVAANPRNADAHAELADTLYALGRYDDAEAEYLLALNLDPDNWNYENRLAVNYAEAARPDKAVVYYRRAAEHHPHHVIYFSLGSALQKLGRLDDAVAAFRKSIELKPTFTMALYELGVIYLAQGRLAESLDSLRKVLQVEPTNIFALYGLAQVYFRSGDKPAAMQQYQLLKGLDARMAAELLRYISQ
jgi:tetratricopeptide (TPR) repeat protein